MCKKKNVLFEFKIKKMAIIWKLKVEVPFKVVIFNVTNGTIQYESLSPRDVDTPQLNYGLLFVILLCFLVFLKKTLYQLNRVKNDFKESH